MSAKALRLVGWILTGLIAVFLLGLSASSKLVPRDGRAEMFEKSGFDLATMEKIAYVEITITVLFLIPQTAFLAAVLLTGYLGGAVCTHVRTHEPFFIPLVLGVLVWIALGLRQPSVFKAALGK